MRHVRNALVRPRREQDLVAKQLGKLLNAHPQDRQRPGDPPGFVGQSERTYDLHFAPAKFKGKGDKSSSILIIFDEIDAIMKARQRGAAASVVHDNVVNQLLTKLDRMQSLDNVLVVGITNRRDLLDPAVLRRGGSSCRWRWVCPTCVDRAQIFNIHTAAMRREAAGRVRGPRRARRRDEKLQRRGDQRPRGGGAEPRAREAPERIGRGGGV